jgi:hypothetical protein
VRGETTQRESARSEAIHEKAIHPEKRFSSFATDEKCDHRTDDEAGRWMPQRMTRANNAHPSRPPAKIFYFLTLILCDYRVVPLGHNPTPVAK